MILPDVFGQVTEFDIAKIWSIESPDVFDNGSENETIRFRGLSLFQFQGSLDKPRLYLFSKRLIFANFCRAK